MAKLNIPKNYLDLTLDELMNNILEPHHLTILDSFKVNKPDDYEKVIYQINEILEESYQLEFLSASEDEEDENKWLIEIGIEETTLEFSIQQEEDKIEDRGLVDGINKFFHKVKADFRLFSYWDSEWDSHSIGFGLIHKKLIKELSQIMQDRKENDWFELFYISE